MTKIVIVDTETTGLLPEIHEVWEIGLIDREELPSSGDYDPPKWEDTEHLWRIYPDLSKADPAALTKNQFYPATEDMRIPGVGNVQTGHVCDLAADSCPQLRHLGGEERPLHWSPAVRVAKTVARMIDGAVVVGANPYFDRDFLRPFLAQHGHAYTAHYRPVCVTGVGFGFLQGQRGRDGDLASVPELDWPLSSDQVSRALGVNPDDYDRHTALGDCRWVAAQWDVITGGTDG